MLNFNEFNLIFVRIKFNVTTNLEEMTGPLTSPVFKL